MVFRGAVAVGHQVAEGGIAVVADGLVEADRGGQAVQLGVVLVERLTVTRRLAQGGAEAGRTITRDADEAGLLVERPADGLTDPERGVGGELEATTPVELVDRVLEAEVAFLDEVEEVHALGEGVPAGDGDDESEVGADEPVLGVRGVAHGHLQCGGLLAGGQLFGGLTACLDDAGQLALVFRSEQGDLADVVQVQTNGVIHDVFCNRSAMRWIPIRAVPGGTLQRPGKIENSCHRVTRTR